jgi:hypothetical protein
MEAPPNPPTPTPLPTSSPDGVPADVKTWAEFNTWYALNHPAATLSDFASAWAAHREYLSTVKKPRKPRAPRAKVTVDSLSEAVPARKRAAPRKKAAAKVVEVPEEESGEP